MPCSKPALRMQHNGTKHFFTSFLSRERCLELIISRWQTERARAEDTLPMASLNPEDEAAASGSGEEVKYTTPRTPRLPQAPTHTNAYPACAPGGARFHSIRCRVPPVLATRPDRTITGGDRTRPSERTEAPSHTALLACAAPCMPSPSPSPQLAPLLSLTLYTHHPDLINRSRPAQHDDPHACEIPRSHHRARAQRCMQGASTAHRRSPSVSMRRRGWPVSKHPPPETADLAGQGWTNVLDQTLQGWEVVDVIQIFEEEDPFFREWHESLGDTCAPPHVARPAWRPPRRAALAPRLLTWSHGHQVCAL